MAVYGDRDHEVSGRGAIERTAAVVSSTAASEALVERETSLMRKKRDFSCWNSPPEVVGPEQIKTRVKWARFEG